MAAKKKRLTARELEVLRWIAEHQPATVREVADSFGSREGLARTTILTVMERLRAQGFLQRQSAGDEGGGYRYRTTRSARALQEEAVHRFVTDMLEGSAAPFVAYLAKRRRKLSDAEVRALRELVDELPDEEGDA